MVIWIKKICKILFFIRCKDITEIYVFLKMWKTIPPFLMANRFSRKPKVIPPNIESDFSIYNNNQIAAATEIQVLKATTKWLFWGVLTIVILSLLAQVASFFYNKEELRHYLLNYLKDSDWYIKLFFGAFILIHIVAIVLAFTRHKVPFAITAIVAYILNIKFPSNPIIDVVEIIYSSINNIWIVIIVLIILGLMPIAIITTYLRKEYKAQDLNKEEAKRKLRNLL